jgi:hypothetical protein
MLKPVQSWLDPVATGQHFAGNFRVAPFIRLIQPAPTQVGEQPEDDENNQEGTRPVDGLPWLSLRSTL